jgi:hypothetical protein
MIAVLAQKNGWQLDGMRAVTYWLSLIRSS